MPASKEEKDIVEIKGEIGRIRHHLDIFKKSNDEFASSLTRIENALVGNIMNGNKGMVKEVADLKAIVQNQNDKLIQYGVYFVILGTVATFCLGATIGVLFKLFME